MNFRKILWLALALVSFSSAQAQDDFSPLDFGKMWTFESANLDYLNKEHNLKLNQEWMDKMRKTALRFSTFCSASFVSPNGLIMTNHHCSVGLSRGLQKDGENFDENGFYAKTSAEERKSEGLFVDQMQMAVDITAEVKDMMKNESISAREALGKIEKKYKAMPAWEGLRTQTVTFYSGGKYSIYGYKRYNDIRLVCIPEESLGFFGGDPDNFTYPRYNLDFTFWRAYDENGKPVDSREFYFPFNTNGVKDGESVFVIGNPGSTERYKTVAQLELDRDVITKGTNALIDNGLADLRARYEANPTDELKTRIFSLANGQKSYRGRLKGLNDPFYMDRKRAAEKAISDNWKKANPGKRSPWEKISELSQDIGANVPKLLFLSPSPIKGQGLGVLNNIYNLVKAGGKNDAGLITKLKESMSILGDPFEIKALSRTLSALVPFLGSQDIGLKEILAAKDMYKFASTLLSKDTDRGDDFIASLAGKSVEDLMKSSDPLVKTAMIVGTATEKARGVVGSLSQESRQLQEEVAYAAFETFGNDLPPDATFTLRISDGKVKSYEYNGTKAPVFTTYFGLYDRYYSHNKEFPWNLPTRWQNPQMDMLKKPLNFISTNDIIGGNSGSAIINSKGEAIGLVFDGNIESLPGNFIFNDAGNRTVSVHAGGIAAALRYIIKADRILRELGQ